MEVKAQAVSVTRRGWGEDSRNPQCISVSLANVCCLAGELKLVATALPEAVAASLADVLLGHCGHLKSKGWEGEGVA